jgi:FtsH-binding integral membrane protein
MSYASDYSPRYEVAAYAPATERATFIRKTYLHLAGAILAFVLVETALVQLVLHSPGAQQFFGMMFSPVGAFILMAAFVGGGWLGSYWAQSTASPTMQYVGLGLYVLLEAVIFLPLIMLAAYSPDLAGAYVLQKAGIMTLALFGGLTAAAFITQKDFSFLGPILCIAGFIVFGLIIAAMIFPSAIQLGLWFSFAMVALASASVLYSTSNVMRNYSTNMHVAAALSLFASIATMFYYILRILIQLNRR